MTLESLFETVPFEMEWIEYKGDVYVGTINVDRSFTAKKPMIDLHYCLTKAFNGIVIKTVQYDKSKFKYPTERAN